MEMSKLLASFENELTFPIDHPSVIEQVGGVEVQATNTQKTETVSTIIGPLGVETYDSAEDLYTTIIGNVSEEYIGRKFYDDRGGTLSEPRVGPTDEVNISF